MLLRGLFLLFALVSIKVLGGEPIALYLTWQHDPSTTMTILWITPKEDNSDRLEYKQGNGTWQQAVGRHSPLPQNYPAILHQAELGHLKPDSEYTFRIPGDERLYKFQTLPTTLTRPIKFVDGGDIYHDDIEFVHETNQQAALTSPDFALLGGDIAYAGKKLTDDHEDAERWITFLKTWTQDMVTPKGKIIPLIPAIGNHDLVGRYDENPDHALFFYTLFPMPGKQGYNVLDFGDYMTLLILDTGHTHPIEGAQTEWLEKTLGARAGFPTKFALYHVPAYPSVRAFDTKKSATVRKYWVPIFEKYKLTTAFEHHEHDYKRSYLLKEGKVDPAGVLYMGDGAWGVEYPRLSKAPEKEWYLAKTAPARHFILVTLGKKQRTYQAIDSKGKVIDSYSLPLSQ